jgi:5-hydroxyisourate hydrolase
MSDITTHVLDISRGRPAAGVPVTLETQRGDSWELLGKGITNADGRIANLLGDAQLAAGVYRLTFDTAAYFADNDTQAFYPQVSVVFKIEDSNQHYHVPLLLSPFGYSTYRGS